MSDYRQVTRHPDSEGYLVWIDQIEFISVNNESPEDVSQQPSSADAIAAIGAKSMQHEY